MMFCINLKKARLNSGLTQNEICEKLGISISTYSSYELGRNYPVLDRAAQLAEILNTSLDKLCDVSIAPAKNQRDIAEIVLKLNGGSAIGARISIDYSPWLNRYFPKACEFICEYAIAVSRARTEEEPDIIFHWEKEELPKLEEYPIPVECHCYIDGKTSDPKLDAEYMKLNLESAEEVSSYIFRHLHRGEL